MRISIIKASALSIAGQYRQKFTPNLKLIGRTAWSFAPLGAAAAATAFGGLTGGVMFRAFYDLNIRLFPETVPYHLAKRVALDQIPWAMPMLALVLTGNKFLIDLSLKNSGRAIRKKYFEMLPINWLVWGGCFCWITYSSASDLMVYISSIFGTIWRAFLNHQAFLDLANHDLPK